MRRILAENDALDAYIFDIFDTLVARLLPPEYIKYLVCVFIHNRFRHEHDDPSAMSIYQLRLEVENELKASTRKAGGDNEYSYRDSMRELLSRLDIDKTESLDAVTRFELQLEDSGIYFHDGVVDAIHDLAGQGKDVFLLSDNYLSEADIRWLLRDSNVLDSISRVVISSEFGVRKDTGRLFDHFLESSRLDPQRVLHVGDNPTSDYDNLLRHGMRAVLLDIPGDRERRERLEAMFPKDAYCTPSVSIIQRALEVSLRQKLHGRDPACVEVGLSLALPFYTYTESLLQHARETGVKKVFFLSREGHLLKAIFDAMRGNEFDSTYVCMSRMSTHFLSMPEITLASLDRMFGMFDAHFLETTSLAQLFAFLRIDGESLRAVGDRYGVAMEEQFRLRVPLHRAQLFRVMLDPRIREAYARTREAHLEIFVDYLESVGLLSEDLILLADIGWAGSMQSFLADVFRERGLETSIHGYYFGYDQVWEKMKGTASTHAGVVKDGFVCHTSNENETTAKFVGRIVMELIATAPHGATCAYERHSDGVKPQFVWSDGEQRQYEELIEPVQSAMLLAIMTSWPLYRKLGTVLSADDMRQSAIQSCLELLSRPSARVARHFWSAALYDDYFGVHRRVPLVRGRWWWEAVCALKGRSLPWRALEWISRKSQLPLDAIRMLSLLRRACGPRPTLRLAYERAFHSEFRPGAEFNILTHYEFKRPPAAVGSASSRRYLYCIHGCMDPEVAHEAARRAALSTNGECEVLFSSSDGKFGVVHVRNRHDVSYAELTATQATDRFDAAEYVIVCGDAVLFEEDFIEHLDRALAQLPHTDLVYTDNDTVCGGRFERPRFKPAWIPEYFIEYDYIGDVVVIRRGAVAGDFMVFSNDVDQHGVYAALLKRMDSWKRVVHVPAVLYHGPFRVGASTPEVRKEAGTSLYGACEMHSGRDGRELPRPVIAEKPAVSIIIPFKNKHEYVERCVDSIEQRSTYENYEIVLVNNASDDPLTLEYLQSKEGSGHIRRLDYDHPFNYSLINNYAIERTESPYILLLNNDTEVLTPRWIEEMLAHALRPEVGAVGARLDYPDGSVQHAGVVFDVGETYPAGHIFHRESEHSNGYEKRLVTVQQYSAVTAACMMMRREVFTEAAGFDAGFEVAYNDLDLCCRLGSRGYRVLWTPHARLLHHENVSRGDPLDSDRDQREREMFRERWRHAFLNSDPYYNLHLHLAGDVKTASQIEDRSS